MRDLNYMWKRLEGTEEEKAYLDKRFNEMSVKEQYVLVDLCQYSRHIFSNKLYATLLDLSSHSWGVI